MTGVSQVQRGGCVRNTEGEANGPRCGGRWGLGPAQVSRPDGEDPVVSSLVHRPAPPHSGRTLDFALCPGTGGPGSVLSKGISLI